MSEELIEYKGVTIRRYKYMMLPCTVRACRYEADVNGHHLTANTRKEIDTLVSKVLKNMIAIPCANPGRAYSPGE